MCVVVEPHFGFDQYPYSYIHKLILNAFDYLVTQVRATKYIFNCILMISRHTVYADANYVIDN